MQTKSEPKGTILHLLENKNKTNICLYFNNWHHSYSLVTVERIGSRTPENTKIPVGLSFLYKM